MEANGLGVQARGQQALVELLHQDQHGRGGQRQGPASPDRQPESRLVGRREGHKQGGHCGQQGTDQRDERQQAGQGAEQCEVGEPDDPEAQGGGQTDQDGPHELAAKEAAERCSHATADRLNLVSPSAGDEPDGAPVHLGQIHQEVEGDQGTEHQRQGDPDHA